MSSLRYKEKALSQKRRGFLFSDRDELAQTRDEKKAPTDTEGGCRVFSFQKPHI